MDSMPDVTNAEKRVCGRGALLVVGCITFLCLAVFVLAYGTYGDRAITELERRCADVSYHFGKQMEEQGNYEVAILRYRQALEGYFGDDEKRYMCGRALAELLTKLGRHQEAINTYRALPPEALDASSSLAGYAEALRRSGDYAETERVALIWFAKARNENNAQQSLWANQTLGSICQTQKRYEEALAYYRAAVELDPASQAGIHIAQIYRQQGKLSAALAALDTFLAHVSSGPFRDDAVRLRDAIRAQQTSK